MKANNVTTITNNYGTATVTTTFDNGGVVNAVIQSQYFPTMNLEPSTAFVDGEPYECMAVTVDGTDLVRYVSTANVHDFIQGVALSNEGYELDVAYVIEAALNDGHILYDFE